MIISPSIASSDLLHIGDEVEFASRYFDDVHIDIEDGVAVQGISFGMKMAKKICEVAKKPTSIHIEVENPLDFLEDCVKCNPNSVFIQICHLDNPEKVIEAYKKCNLNVGLALTDLDINKNYESLYHSVKQILMLTAFHNDPLQQYSIDLEEFAISLHDKYGLDVWLDGGVNWDIYNRLNIQKKVYAVVMGRAVFSDKQAALRNKNIKI